MDIKSRLDLTEVFCDVDDFYQSFEKHCHSIPQLTASVGEKLCSSRLSLCEVMTIVIAFHGSGYRTLLFLADSNVPDLPGCVAVGETLEEVKQLIAEAVIFHLEGLKEDGLTVPKSVSICEYVDVA
jgi:predicted RNase H-like HicB family nuclease